MRTFGNILTLTAIAAMGLFATTAPAADCCGAEASATCPMATTTASTCPITGQAAVCPVAGPLASQSRPAPSIAVQPVALTGHEHGGDKSAAPAAESSKTTQSLYANAACPIMGGKTNPALFVSYANPKTHTYAKIYICCPGCEQKVKDKPAAAYSKAYLDREIRNAEGKVIAKKGEPAKLNNKTCPVSGEEASSKYAVTFNGYTINFCCPDCEKTFVKSPEKSLTELIKKEGLVLPGKERPGEKSTGQKPTGEKHAGQEHAAAHLSK